MFMDKVKNFKVIDIISSVTADDDDKGNKVFAEIIELSKEHNNIVVDFNGIELVNTAFLNNAIGRLFNREEFDLSKCRVKVGNMNEVMMDLLRESIELARQKYR